MKQQFDLYEYLQEEKEGIVAGSSTIEKEENEFQEFFKLCSDIQAKIIGGEEETKLDQVKIQRGAIMGQESEISYYKEKIRGLVMTMQKSGLEYPPWYKNLVDGIFAELFGFAGLSPWIYDESEEYRYSTSAKIIGGRIYFLLEGRCILQKQRLSQQRLEQLKRALLMGYPKERLETGVHEVYLNNGIRVTIFSGNLTKAGNDVIVFRKYVMKSLSFDKLASYDTIPKESIPFFERMVEAGFNVLFSGPVRSGKTTFLQTWQSYEDKSLEGVSIATDTETDWNKIMGDAPFMQLVADGEDMEKAIKPLLRGDNDYVILEEMRDAVAFNFAVDITSIGTRRTKATIHGSEPCDIPYKMATKIAYRYGGNIEEITQQIFKSFQFIFQMRVDELNPGHRVLDKIVELVTNPNGEIEFRTILKYDWDKKRWQWNKLSKRVLYEEELIGKKRSAIINEELFSLYQESPLYENEEKKDGIH